MRTVDDLRAALVALEREAPDLEALLAERSTTTPQSAPHHRRWLLPAVAAGATITVALAAAGLVALRSGSDGPAGSSHHPTGPAATGDGRLLPFRLTSPLPQLTLIDVHSGTNPARPFGTAVLAEYGMEVTIDVSAFADRPTRSASASRVAVGGVEGWIDVGCGVRPAVSSSATSGEPTLDAAWSDVNPTCSLTYDRGPWQVAIYVAGPGGGSRKITSEQFRQIGDHLQLADSPGDRSTWYPSGELLPN